MIGQVCNFFEGNSTLSLPCEAKSCVWCKSWSGGDFQVVRVHLCLRAAWGFFASVVIYEHKSKLEIMYSLKPSDIWKLACYLRDIWPYWIRSCHSERSKGSWNIVELMWLVAIVPIAYGTIAKKKAGFTPFLCFLIGVSLIDGKWLFCSHTLLSDLTSPSCNLTAQRKFCCLLLFRANTKATTKTKLKSWSQFNSSSYSCVSHCFLDSIANNKSNSSSRWHVSNFKFD